MPITVDLAVVGGGASGMAAAITASEKGESVIILEAGPALGRKITASGNGRCNLMNDGKPRYYGEPSFAETVMCYCGVSEQLDFWHHLGVSVSREDNGRYYPCSFQAATVTQALKTALAMNHVKIFLNTPCYQILREVDGIFLVSAPGLEYFAKRVLIASGGAASKKLGGSDSGYSLLKDFGHSLVDIRPALVPLLAEKKSISGLAGIRFRCGVKLLSSSGKTLHQETGEVLFTEYGISGICVMQCARFVNGNDCIVELDLGKMIFPDDNALKKEILFRKDRFRGLPPDMLLNGILPAKLSFAVMKQSGLLMRGETIDELDDDCITGIIRAFRHYRIPISGTKGLDDAQVTAGGIRCQDFFPDNLESRIVPGLHAAGEVLDIDGDCGGFNLMFAFGSGILAGLNRYSAPWV